MPDSPSVAGTAQAANIVKRYAAGDFYSIGDRYSVSDLEQMGEKAFVLAADYDELAAERDALWNALVEVYHHGEDSALHERIRVMLGVAL